MDVNEKVVLMFVRNDVMYPVAMTESQLELLQLLVKPLEPIRVLSDSPQGSIVNLAGKRTN